MGATRPGTGAPARVYRFGPFVLDVSERLLLRDGRPVPLTPKAFDLLAYLAERPGRLVEKRELMAGLWPDSVVEESNLAYTVSALRKALGDGADEEQVIQTVPTKGYRFVAAVTQPEPSPPLARRPTRLALLVATTAVLGGAVGAVVARRVGPSGDAGGTVTRFELASAESRDAVMPAISPDGRRIVYAARLEGRRQWFVRSLDSLQAVPLPGLSGGMPFFTPDSRSITYCDGSGFVTLDIAAGGTTRIEAPDCRNGTGAGWGPDVIYYSRLAPLGLARISARGGPSEELTTLGPGDIVHVWPDLLPDGRQLLFTVSRGDKVEQLEARVLSLDTGEVKTVMVAAARARFVAPGHLVFSRSSNLLTVPFDPHTLQARGEPERVIEGVATPNIFPWAPLYAVSPRGTLVYHAGGVFNLDTAISVFDTSTQGFAPVTAAAGLYVDPVLSPDGTRLAISKDVGQQDLWAHDFARRTWTRLTHSPRLDSAPVWHPLDPERLIYSSIRPGGEGTDLVTIRADGSDSPQVLYENANEKYACSTAPTGLVAFTELAQGRGFDIWILDLKGKPTARPFLRTPFNETSPSFSPDGRWIAYDSNESGAMEVYVRPVSGDGRWPVSAGGGSRPRWTRDGRTIVYRRLRRADDPPGPDRMMAVDVTTSPSFSAGTPRVMAQGAFAAGGTATANYDVSADGRRLLLITRPAETPRLPLIVVEHWASELRQKQPR